ncbi:hypothetical protein GA565_20130 [Rouxiella sp. S1S-2]|uniref:hypothetical protein n=1 Tax=Rouxiella sp. S1S-2 TaxID=2653856 RepID=UPI001264DBBA|nr:hypothetical protein [Rouxiella sp. S1S-2]KAB7898095.1 hypothetical protein GA565_20130 [Rouxiella sp. S1S-2]
MFSQTIGAPLIQSSSVSSSLTPVVVSPLTHNITSIRQGPPAAHFSSSPGNAITQKKRSNPRDTRVGLTQAALNHLIKWRDMTIEKRIAAGGMKGYACTHGINLNFWRSLTNSAGLTVLGQQKLSPQEIMPIENHHLEKWRDMTYQKRIDAGGATGYAHTHHLNVRYWRDLVKNSGLLPLASQRLVSYPIERISERHLIEWRDMSSDDRKSIGGNSGYAFSRRINVRSWRLYAKVNGLTAIGLQKIKSSEMVCIQNYHLKAWLTMSQLERDNIGGTTGYALSNNISAYRWRLFANRFGLTMLGLQKMSSYRPQRVENCHLIEWQNMSITERKAIGGNGGFAEKHKISLGVLRRLTTIKGLTVLGAQRLTPTELGPIKIEHLEKWRNLTMEQRRAAGGLGGFATAEKINLGNLWNLVSVYGLKKRGERLLLSKKMKLINAPDADKSYSNTLGEKTPNQIALNNQKIAAVAKENACFICIKDIEGQLSIKFGPEGQPIERIPLTATPAKIMTLRVQRENNKLVYDAIRPGPMIKTIAVSPRDEDNLYHALIKALHPHSTEDDCLARISAMRLIK